jgi:hypothetical protein
MTDVWFEKNGKASFCKVRFEKRDLSQKSWWSPKGSPDPLPASSRDNSMKVERPVCRSCRQESPRVYQEGWMCLAPKCTKFWKLNRSSPPANLTYNVAFLLERSSAPLLAKPPKALVPSLPQQSTIAQGAFAVTETAMDGVVCTNCHTCVARVHWREWRCETTGCGFVHRLDLPRLSAMEVTSWRDRFDGHAIPNYEVDPAIAKSTTYLENYRKDIFVLSPGNVIGLFAANETINCRMNGPNDMFIQMQEADLGLERYGLQTKIRKFIIFSFVFMAR